MLLLWHRVRSLAWELQDTMCVAKKKKKKRRKKERKKIKIWEENTMGTHETFKWTTDMQKFNIPSDERKGNNMRSQFFHLS